MNYYNENDPNAAAWLRQLIHDGLIPAGEVDERSIKEIKPNELHGYTQHHFFAGIGGWSLALELAGWPATRPVWTGSCPCQPFSVAGKGRAQFDERHLWPTFFELIRAYGPGIVFGEQVASADVVGKARRNHGQAVRTVWLDGVCADLEAEGYTTGAVVLGAHSVGAPHIRQRLYWVANAGHQQSRRSARPGGAESGRACDQPAGRNAPLRLANSECEELQGLGGHGDGGREPGRIDAVAPGSTPSGGTTLRLGDASCGGLGIVGHATQPGSSGHVDGAGDCGRMADTAGASGPEQQRKPRDGARRNASSTDTAKRGGAGGLADSQHDGRRPDEPGRRQEGRAVDRRTGNTAYSSWSECQWLRCRDGKHRRIPTEPALFPLADGISYRMARRRTIRPPLLKGPGNAIVPDLAAEFIAACCELIGGPEK